MHLEIVHAGLIEKYECRGDYIAIVLAKSNSNLDSSSTSPMSTYLSGITRTTKFHNQNYKISPMYSFANSYDSSSPFSQSPHVVSLSHKHSERVQVFISNLLQKLQKLSQPSSTQHKQIYFHSTNIFKRVNPDDL